uniref:Uncharacterized protein n=1 Tax=Anguilla anguilla TaxID=7936 RepID=A0A0E9T5P8_ANGAN
MSLLLVYCNWYWSTVAAAGLLYPLIVSSSHVVPVAWESSLIFSDNLEMKCRKLC